MSDHLEDVGEMLETMSDGPTARRLRKQVQPLRGVRGVPLGEVARIAAAAFEEGAPTLPADAAALGKLFGTAWEDGLVAIGLLASCVPETPLDALELGLAWAPRVDDVTTADALGWLVIGPGALASGSTIHQATAELRQHRHGSVRRIAVSAAMAATPATVEGPAAAPIRARLGQPRVRWVETAQADQLGAVASASLRDEDPAVRKAMRRLLRTWADADAAAVQAWAAAVRGGLPKMLRAEVDRARKIAARAP